MRNYMFHSNIINIYGEKGKAWLDELPQLVAAISSRLDLRDLKEVTSVHSGPACFFPLRLKPNAFSRELFLIKNTNVFLVRI
jgi:hypothetical protein